MDPSGYATEYKLVLSSYFLSKLIRMQQLNSVIHLLSRLKILLASTDFRTQNRRG